MQSLETKVLTVHFGEARALTNLSVSVSPGVTALLGENGAGKTTLIRALATLQPPTSGDVVVDGLPVSENHGGYRSQVGYMPQDIPRSPRMTTEHYLEYFALLKNVNRAQRSRAGLIASLSAVGLSESVRVRVNALSGGMLRRLGLAVARLGNPDLLLLDEPTVGLDPLQRVDMRNLISAESAQQRILVSTHLSEDVAAMADRVIMLHQGQLAFDGTLNDFARMGEGERPQAEDVERAFISRSHGALEARP